MAQKIQWMDWSPEAFERAKREDKLILLDISAHWCHWCHTMDEDTYGNRGVIRLVNEHFIPVRVDYDKRPDINDRYNQGGWPTTVILTHEGFVVHGAVYLPPDALKGLLKQAKKWSEQNRERISKATEIIAAEAARRPVATAEPQEVNDLTDDIMENMMHTADFINGGFGFGEKFPQPAAISVIFAQFFRTRKQNLLDFAEKTLRNMGEGLLDREEGGMFRYSVTPEWNMPHYEKNLSVNAECLQNYLDAYRITGKREYADTAEDIIKFVMEKLSDPLGGFYSSQDADVVDEKTGKIIMDGETYYKLGSLERRKHPAPSIDKSIYVNSTSRMISALLDACHVLGKAEWRDFALLGLRRLMTECMNEKLGACHYLAKEKGAPYFLADTVALAHASLDAYETTAERGFLDKARQLSDIAQKRFGAKDGGFFDSVMDQALPPATRISHKPFHDNMLAVEMLARLYNYTAGSAYLRLATITLATFVPNVQHLLSQDLGYSAADYALTVPYVNDSSTKVTVIGSASDERSVNLIREAKKLYRPAKIIQLLDLTRDKDLIDTMNYPLEDNLPVVHVCTERGCAPPVQTVGEMAKLLLS